MSQFKVEKVTKVRGLTDLSDKAKIGEKNESLAKRKGNSATVTERLASSNGRQTSVKKSSVTAKATSSDTGKSSARRTPISHHATTPPKPATRSKQSSTAAAASVASKSTEPVICCATCEALYCQECKVSVHEKSCPASQQRKTTPNSSAESAKKRSPQGAAVPPVPQLRATVPLSQKTGKDDQKTKRKSELKKESSYDASDSDSEKGSRDRLNTDGDFGYETGSLDDSDVSTGEPLSPSAKDEQKTILTPGQSDNDSSCTYAKIDITQLPTVGEGGTDVQSPETEIEYTELSLHCQGISDSAPYTYAGNEFRPLIVQEGIGIAAPVKSRTTSEIVNTPNEDGVVDLCSSGKAAPLEYEEVKIVDGSFDRSNVKVVPSNQRTPDKDNENATHIIGPKNDLYAVVQKKPKGVENKDNSTQLPRQSSPMQKPIVELGDVVPAIPGGRKDSNMYQAITGELQSMIIACDNVQFEEISSRKNSVEKRTASENKRIPPPMPKPYAGSGLKKLYTEKAQNGEAKENTVKDVGPQDCQVMYATVQKPAKTEKSKSLESLDQLRIPSPSDDNDEGTSDGEMPPPLPSRLPNLEETFTRTKKSEDCADFAKEEQVEKKPKKGGALKLFKRKHRRQMSDGNLVLDKDMEGSLAPSPKFQHQRSKSQADVLNIVGNEQGRISRNNVTEMYTEIDIQPQKVESSSDKNQPIKPYMEVDISQPPLTPTELKEKTFIGGESEDYSGPYELPEGWKEVKSDSGTYYWHVASGTTQWTLPQVATRPKKKVSEDTKSSEVTEKQKVLSFPVHSMGWIELEESQVAPHNMSETITNCISSLAELRKDLWNTSETWGEGKDMRLLLEADALKLVEPRTKDTLLVQPVSKMRVWGVGKEDQRDFAFVARDPSTGKHKCHMFRCHGIISGRTITNALHDLCSKILEKKKKAQENDRKMSAQKPWSDIINTPPPSSARDNASFNEKPHVEPKKSFSAKYAGSIDVAKPTGVEILNKAISKLTSKGGVWRTILIEISVSNIKITDCATQELISEDRVRFMSFFGVGKDERLCGYIVSTAPDVFLCHVFHCTPNAAALTKALAEACQLRFQKCVDAHPEIIQKVAVTEQEKLKEKVEKDKAEKDKAGFMTSVQGLLGKLGPKKGGGKKEENQAPDNKSSNIPVITCKPTHTFMVKYYGALPVAVGTGIETVEEAAKHLAGGTLLVCQLDVALNGVTLYDSQRSALSKRNLDADTISYCGLTSSRSHFGLIQSMGGGKYICHVFAEYKTKAAPIVAAIHETL